MAATVLAKIPSCNVTAYREIGYLSEDGTNCSRATYFSLLASALVIPPDDEQVEIMCTNPQCQRMLAAMNKEFPTECTLPFNMTLRETFLDVVEDACPSSGASRAPVPTTAVPVPTTTAPAPTTTAPAPTTTAPALLKPMPGDCNVTTYLAIGYGSKIGYSCYQATRYSLLASELISPPNAKQLETMCTDSRCISMIADMNKAFPDECLMIFDTPLRATFLDPVVKACATMTPSPTTPSPPVPTTTAPVPTTTAPAPTTTAPTPAPTTTAPAVLNGPCGNEQVGAQKCPGDQYCQPWNPTQYQCRSIDAKCGVQEVGVDYYGDDLASFQLTLPEDCCTKCTTTPGCKAYTFVNYNADGKAYCYLKKGTGQKSKKTGVVSATIVAPAETCSTPAWGNCSPAGNGASCCPSGFYCQPWNPLHYQCIQTPAKCSQQFTGVDFYGEDIATVYSIGPGECCGKCAATAGCKAYTYVNDYMSNGVAMPACYLKKGTGVKQANAHAVSGLVN